MVLFYDMRRSVDKNPTASSTRHEPRVVYGKGIDPSITSNSSSHTETMRQLAISEEGIAKTTIILDPKRRFLNYGTHYPNKVGRLRFRSNPEIQSSKGDIIRLSTVMMNWRRMKFEPRTAERMNVTNVHELEHVAQQDRHDRKVTQGHIAIYGLAVLGAIAGNRLNRGVKGKVGATIGGFLGYQLGYRLAPHERQARLRAGQVRGLEPQVVSKAIERKSYRLAD